jgi:hypothetical protein
MKRFFADPLEQIFLKVQSRLSAEERLSDPKPETRLTSCTSRPTGKAAERMQKDPEQVDDR